MDTGREWSIKNKLPIAIFVILLAVMIQIALQFVFAPTPKIYLEKPEVGLVNEGKQLFVSGKVTPAASRITANGFKVALNGDGTFTAVLTIPPGQSTLTIKASYLYKNSEVLRIVNRNMTEEEKVSEKLKRDELEKLVVTPFAPTGHPEVPITE